MVRPCIIKGCTNTDLTGLAHRFPKKRDLCLEWQKILKLEDLPLELLQAKYVVCTAHFHKSDYRNPVSNFLNLTAIPHLPPEEASEKTAESPIMNKEVEESMNTETVEEEDEQIEYIITEADEEDPEELEIIHDEEYVVISSGVKRSFKELDTMEPRTHFDNKVIRLSAKEPYLDESASELFSDDASEEAENDRTREVYVELQDEETQTDFKTSDNIIQAIQIKKEFPDYVSLSRIDIIRKLKASEKTIEELQEKLANIEKANADMVKSLENVKKLLGC